MVVYACISFYVALSLVSKSSPKFTPEFFRLPRRKSSRCSWTLCFIIAAGHIESYYSITPVHYSHARAFPVSTCITYACNSHLIATQFSQGRHNAFSPDSPGLPTYNRQRADRISWMPSKTELQLRDIFPIWTTSTRCAQQRIPRGQEISATEDIVWFRRNVSAKGAARLEGGKL